MGSIGNNSYSIHLFNNWIIRNYLKIREVLSLEQSLDEDCLNDAYISSINIIMNERKDDEFLKIFIQQYNSEKRKSFSVKMRNIYPDPIFFDFLHGEEVEESIVSVNEIPTYSTVILCAKKELSKTDYNLFYLNMIKGFSYHTIAEYTGKSDSSIYRKSQEIKNRIRKIISTYYKV